MIHIFNCNWVDTRWQWNSTHLQTNNTQTTENGTYITIKKLTNLGSAGRVPSLRVIPWHFPYNRKKHGKTSVRVVARTSQADSTIHEKNSNTEYYNVTRQ
jgi:hypothetical protein